MVIWGGCGQLNRFLIATSQRLLSHPGLDELPIRLSSGCKFRAVHLARDTRATTDVVAASLCEAIFRGVVVLCAGHRSSKIIMGRDQPLLKLRPGEQRPSLQNESQTRAITSFIVRSVTIAKFAGPYSSLEISSDVLLLET